MHDQAVKKNYDDKKEEKEHEGNNGEGEDDENFMIWKHLFGNSIEEDTIMELIITTLYSSYHHCIQDCWCIRTTCYDLCSDQTFAWWYSIR